jgi:excisionase family DNA binding protein
MEKYSFNQTLSNEIVGQACHIGPAVITSAVQPLFDNSIMKETPYLTSHELAIYLKVSVHAVRKWRSQGRIHPYQFGRSVRYVASEVVAALARKGKRNAK